MITVALTGQCPSRKILSLCFLIVEEVFIVIFRLIVLSQSFPHYHSLLGHPLIFVPYLVIEHFMSVVKAFSR